MESERSRPGKESNQKSIASKNDASSKNSKNAKKPPISNEKAAIPAKLLLDHEPINPEA